MRFSWKKSILRTGLAFAILLSWVLADRPYVILMSFDGFRYDYTEKAHTPNFDRMAQEGVRAESLKPIFPTKTFPNHYTIATGMYAENHGIVANLFWDPVWNETYSLSNRKAVRDPKWYGGEPIWVTAEKQGVKTASYFWVGSEAPIGGIFSTYLYHYKQDVPFGDRVNEVLRLLRLPAEKRPHFVSLYFHEPDWSGHSYGPDSPETIEAVEEADSILGLLLDGVSALEISGDVNIIVCSDHGMTRVYSDSLIFIDDYIDLSHGRMIGQGPFAFLDMGNRESAGLVKGFFKRRAHKKIAEKLDKAHPHMRAYLRNEIPGRWHFRRNRRILDILLVADEGWTITTRDEYESNPNRFSARGTHGYDNINRDMHAIFYARGPAFKEGYVMPTFMNVHIYPLIAKILEIEPYEKIDGNLDSVKAMLK